MDGPVPSEMDIKVNIPAPTFYLQVKKIYSLNGKMKKFFLRLESEIKQNKNRNCTTLNMWINMDTINNHHPRIRFISNNYGSLVFTFWK